MRKIHEVLRLYFEHSCPKREIARFCRIVEYKTDFVESSMVPAHVGRITDLSCQRAKLVSERHRDGSVNDELALPNHMHQLDASEHIGRNAERLEAQHWPRHPLDFSRRARPAVGGPSPSLLRTGHTSRNPPGWPESQPLRTFHVIHAPPPGFSLP